MKRYFSIIFILGLGVLNLFAQDEPQVSGRRAAAAATEKSTTVSQRAQNMYGNTEINTDNVIWLREIYRDLDLKKEKNGPLYFPVEPIGNRINLFTLIFNLLAEGKIQSYEYLDGREVFTDKYKVDFKDILTKFGIYYQESLSKSAKSPAYTVHESDIPSNEALSFYLKEMWYFDQASSTFNSQIIALCPLLSRTGDFGGEALKYPMCWVKYEDLRPYLSQVQIMTSNYNNVLSATYNDYFTQRLYDGEIYKTTNLANLAIVQYAETDSLQNIERKRIENELIAFEKNLWQNPDSLTIENLRNKKKLNKQERDLLRKLEADEKKKETAVTEDVATKEETPKIAAEPAKPAASKSVQNKKTTSSSKAPKQQKSASRSVRRR